MKRILILLFLLMPLVPSPAMAVAQPTANTSASDPASTAIDISVLESQGRFSRIYDQMHPDAQKIIPRSTVVGWYENEFGPLGPGEISVTDVQYDSWTWPVTGTTYPNTAEIFFEQPFANGTTVAEVVRLVEHDGEWKWFFGRSLGFVEEQIAIYGGSVGISNSETRPCSGSDIWWQTTMPNIGSTEYLSFTLVNIVDGGPVDPALLDSYADSYASVRISQIDLTPPPAAAALHTDLLDILEVSRRLTQNLNSAESGLDVQSVEKTADAIAEGFDLIDTMSQAISAGSTDFITECQPLVVFVFGMGEDRPVGVLPGEVGAEIPEVDCELIDSQVDAQDFFEAAGVGDPHRIDDNGNGIACETGE